ncbi:MAG: GAF domain-containing protein [Candidatus Omnitrophica bacterium]|nr:GAF domain-containing protein [Candidatus Omnitrophota bacterium]
MPAPVSPPRGTRLPVTKFTLFVGLYALIVGVPLVLLIGASGWLHVRFETFWWVIPALVMTLLASAAPLIYLTILRRLEGRILRDQRRYHRTLIAASSGMTRIKDIQTLCRLIVHVINRAVGLTHTGLFLYDTETQRYVLRAVRHKRMMPAELTVEPADPLIELLQEQKDILLLEELQAEMDMKRSDERAKQAAWAYSWMRKLEALLIVPSFSGEKLLAFLVLGAKRNGERYTTDDIAMFSALANQGALAIENAMFFEELRANESYIIQSEKLASLGQMASGMAHEIHNPLAIISGEAQVYLERFKGQDVKVDAVLLSIIEECQRAADITRRILRFAKPAPADFVAVDLKATLEESLTLAGYQVRMENVERSVSVPQELPKVRGNQNQLQEVILNLILNACQAMGEQGGKLVLSASASNGAQVEVKVEDTGPGIPANKLTKVFDPFYTTKATGTGLGLFVSQRIVKLHGGTIDVASTIGQGTTFTIRLPAVK